jgi:Notch-like protein
VEECASNPCQNGGLCVDGIGFYFCVCNQTEYTGINCQNLYKPCTSYQCYNQGTCVDDLFKTYCLCAPGFTGTQCQFKLTCSVICQNGGVCNSTANGCLCPSNYGGSDCSVVQNFCTLLNPCQNSGACVNTPNSYSCTCLPGFTGTNCQTALTV